MKRIASILFGIALGQWILAPALATDGTNGTTGYATKDRDTVNQTPCGATGCIFDSQDPPHTVVIDTSTYTHTGHSTVTYTSIVTETSPLVPTQYAVTVPTTVDQSVGVVTITNVAPFGAAVFVGVVVHTSGFGLAKTYSVPLAYNATAGDWHTVLPLSSTGAWGTDDVALDVSVSASTAYLRVRRVSGSTAATAYVSVQRLGSLTPTSLSALTSTYTTTAVSTYTNTPLGAEHGEVDVAGNLAVTGDVGIGVAAPSYKLEVLDSASAIAHLESTGEFAWLQFQTSDGADKRGQIGLVTHDLRIDNLNTDVGTGITFGVGGVPRLKLFYAGGLSLGTSYSEVDPGANTMAIQGRLAVGTTSTSLGVVAVEGWVGATTNALICGAGLSCSGVDGTGSGTATASGTGTRRLLDATPITAAVDANLYSVAPLSWSIGTSTTTSTVVDVTASPTVRLDTSGLVTTANNIFSEAPLYWTIGTETATSTTAGLGNSPKVHLDTTGLITTDNVLYSESPVQLGVGTTTVTATAVNMKNNPSVRLAPNMVKNIQGYAVTGGVSGRSTDIVNMIAATYTRVGTGTGTINAIGQATLLPQYAGITCYSDIGIDGGLTTAGASGAAAYAANARVNVNPQIYNVTTTKTSVSVQMRLYSSDNTYYCTSISDFGGLLLYEK